MAKNYASIYNQTGDSIALEQRFYIKEETVKGTLNPPADDDFMFTIEGGSVNKTQPFESSPHRTGRHNTSVIKQKIETTWTIPSYFNIDTTLGAPAAAETDQAFRVLMKSAYGNESEAAGVVSYQVGTPDINFSIFEIGDMWAKQSSGAYVETANATFPGDGQAQIEFGGNAKNALLIGIGKSTSVDNNGGNVINVQPGEGLRFKVGGHVMLIEADGVTRSADTPAGSSRIITDVTADAITLDGAVLADADASSADLFLSYYEPESPSGINNPVTGLVGDVTLAGHPNLSCIRSANFNLTNNHEALDFCYGFEGLGDGSFTAGGRADVNVELEVNLNHGLIELINSLDDIPGDSITLILGDAAGRHLEVLVPKALFSIPEISVPASGSIPVTLTSLANQTGLDLADEITYNFN